MKKVVLLVVTVICFINEVKASDFFMPNGDGDTIYYVIISSNSVEVASSGGTYSGHINIPSSVIYNGNTYVVEGLGEYAFNWCKSLISVTLPNTITFIENFAFMNCDSLIAVNIPDSVTYIGLAAFYETAITSITIPQSVTFVQAGAFTRCYQLKTLNYNAKRCSFNRYIGNSHGILDAPVFGGCHSLTEVNIGDSVTYITANFINNCNGLNTIRIPDNVDKIGYNAFENCPNLIHISLGSGIKYIESGAFSTNPLGSIICNMTEAPTLNTGVFNEGTLNDARVLVPCNSITFYEEVEGWKGFKHLIDPCVDLADVEQLTFNLYPNPATTELNISCSEKINVIEILNILGQRVYSTAINNTEATINVANFKTGHYIAKIYTDNSILTKKFIVNNK